MWAKLASVNHLAATFLSRAAVKVCWYYYSITHNHHLILILYIHDRLVSCYSLRKKQLPENVARAL